MVFSLFKKLSKAATTIVLCSLLFFSAAVYPVSARFPCINAHEAIKRAIKEGYTFIATATAEKHYVIQVYVNEYGEFKIIAIDDKDMACTIFAGYGWQFSGLQGV